MKKITSYLLTNISISVGMPVIASFILILFNKININDLFIIIAFIPGIFYKLLLNFNLSNPLIFFVLPYFIYYTLFILVHYYFLKYSKEYVGFIFTFFATTLNIYFGFQTYILFTS